MYLQIRLINFWTCDVDYKIEIFSVSWFVRNKRDGHEIWPDNDFANSCQKFGRTKKSYSYSTPYSLTNIKPGSHSWDKHKHKHKRQTYARAESLIHKPSYFCACICLTVVLVLLLISLLWIRLNTRSLEVKNSYTKPWGGGSIGPPLLLSTQFIRLTWNLVHITSFICTFN